MSPFVAGLIVGAFVFTPFGMVLMACLTSGAVEDASRAAYRRGREAGLQAAQTFRRTVGQSKGRAVERAVMAERN